MSAPAGALPVSGARTAHAELLRQLKARPWATCGAVTALVAAAAVGLAGPALLGRTVDAVRAGEGNTVLVLAVLLGCAGLVHGVAGGLAHTTVARLGEQVLADLRSRVVERVLRLPHPVVEAAGRGEILARASGDVRVVGDVVTFVVPNVAGSGFAVVATAAGLAVIDPRLLAAAACALPIEVLALRWYLRRSAPRYAEARAAAGDRSRLVLEVVDAAETITAIGWRDRFERATAVSARRAADAEVAAVRLGARFWGRVNLAELVALSAVLVTGYLLVDGGSVTVGGATAAVLYVHRLFDPVGEILTGIDALQRAGAALARVMGVLQMPEPPRLVTAAGATRGETTAGTHPGPAKGAALTVRGLEFRYAETRVLHGVDLDVEAGTTVAVVGLSGAGKSTLAGIVAGLLEPTAGTLTIDGHDVRGLGPGARGVALVSQDVHVFAGTLADDLRLAAPGASDADLHEALAIAGADAWVAALPDGLGTRIGPDGVVPGPLEAQRVALARAALRDPRILVLDEAAVEASGRPEQLEAAISRLAAERTTLVIAHQLGQAAVADRVVLMDAGRVVEQGPHADLVAAGGAYARLWNAWSAAGPQATRSSYRRHVGPPGGPRPGAREWFGPMPDRNT